MAFYFSRRKLKVKEQEDTGELNIVPYLDILMNLIIFMLLSMTGLAAFGILNVNAPNYGPAAGAPSQTGEQQHLLLNVAISRKGFYVAGAGAVLGGPDQLNTTGEPTIPQAADGGYDFPGLTATVVKVKEAFQTETKVIVAAEADTPYAVLIDTMDAIRETKDHRPLFPDVTLGAF